MILRFSTSLHRRGIATAAIIIFVGIVARADDGYRLWMRYDPLPEPLAATYRTRIQSIVVSGESDTLAAIREELYRLASSDLFNEIQAGLQPLQMDLITR